MMSFPLRLHGKLLQGVLVLLQGVSAAMLFGYITAMGDDKPSYGRKRDRFRTDAQSWARHGCRNHPIMPTAMLCFPTANLSFYP